MFDQQTYMIGIPTVRQIRVISADLEYCDAPVELRPSECFRPYKLEYVDSADYSREWSVSKRKPVLEMDKIWTYSTWEVITVRPREKFIEKTSITKRSRSIFVDSMGLRENKWITLDYLGDLLDRIPLN